MLNAVIPELVGVLIAQICTQKWPSCLMDYTSILWKSVAQNLVSRPINGSPLPFPAFHQFCLLEKSPGVFTTKLYLLGSLSFRHFEVDEH